MNNKIISEYLEFKKNQLRDEQWFLNKKLEDPEINRDEYAVYSIQKSRVNSTIKNVRWVQEYFSGRVPSTALEYVQIDRIVEQLQDSSVLPIDITRLL